MYVNAARVTDGYIKQAMGFRYFALNTEMRWRAPQTEQVYVRQNPEDSQLTLEDLQSMVDSDGEFFESCVTLCS